MPQGNTNNTETQETYLNYLNNYFGGKDKEENEIKPICREERQYALFLYNKLLNLVGKEYRNISDEEKEFFKKFIDIENNENSYAKILQVYYEVTFMRDFLEQEKQIYEKNKDLLGKAKESKCSFNHKLFDFVKDNSEGLLNHIDNKSNEYNIISDEINESKCSRNENSFSICPNINYCSRASDKLFQTFKKKFLFISSYMSAMMNSKADLGILYLKEDKLHLKFIECKYKSRVKPYDMFEKANNNDAKFLIKQYVIQYYVTKFICSHLFLDNIIADYPIFLRFVINEENDLTTSKKEICAKLCKKNTTNNKCNDENCNYEYLNCKGNKDYYEYCIEFVSKYIEGNEKQILISKIVPQILKDSVNEIKSFSKGNGN